jgi:uncharacterized protein
MFNSAARARPIPGAVATQGVDVRREFIKRTYGHLAGAVGAFVAVEYLLFKSGVAADLFLWAFAGGRWNWLIFLGMFMVVGYVADKWARSETSQRTQYLGLGLYVIAEAIIFAPLLYVAAYYSHPDVIPNSALVTLMIFGGLTATVFLTKKDFSFLRGALAIGTMAAFALILGGIIFGFNLGLFFSIAMIVLASGYILYYTSQILAHYPPTAHVAAALALFAAVALLFWYVLQLMMTLGRE